MKQVRRIRKTAQENRLVRARLTAAPEDVTTTNAKGALIQAEYSHADFDPLFRSG